MSATNFTWSILEYFVPFDLRNRENIRVKDTVDKWLDKVTDGGGALPTTKRNPITLKNISKKGLVKPSKHNKSIYKGLSKLMLEI